MREAELPEEGLHLRPRPELRGAERGHAVQVEGPAAEDPALDEVGMDVGRLLDREVALVDGAVPPGPEA